MANSGSRNFGSMASFNKSFKFVSGLKALHRTAFPLRSKAAA